MTEPDTPDQPTAGRRRRRVRRWVVAGVVLLLSPGLLLGLGLLALLVADLGPTPASARGSGRDAIWLGHAWLDGRRDQSDVDALAARLRRARVRDVYLHTGPLADDGSLDPGLRPRADWFLAALRGAVPGVRVQAWLGDVVGSGHLDLADPATRARVLDAAGQVLADGFDGVHYDLEPVPDGDPGLLALLADTHRLTAPRHALLSVSADQLEPLPGLHTPEQAVFGRPHFWSTGYLRAVADRVDQVAVMAYDSAVPLTAAFSGYLRIQTTLAMQAVPPAVDLVIGLPAYHTDELGHTDAETVAAAVRGLRLAVADQPRPVGAALYVDFAATEQDWSAYLTGWVDPG